MIDSLTQNGVLQWTGPTNGVQNYRVEWAPSLGGPWSSSWLDLASIPPSNTIFRASVPMFYRVVAVVLPGETLENAIRAYPGVYQGTLVGYQNNLGTGAGCVGTAGPDCVYSIEVPAHNRLTATVGPTFWDVSINLMISTNLPRVCVAGKDSKGIAMSETLVYTNSTDTAVSLYVVVEGPDQAVGEYTLNLELLLTGLREQ